MSPPSLVFSVRRQEPELVAPAKPTPRELKPLSDLDGQKGFRLHIPGLMIYRNNPSMKGKDPVKVIREATAQTLVFYYPYAGRIREGPDRKLSLDCTGDGVMLVEADADVTLEDFGPVLQPPFPGSDGILHCPLVLIQVTRLKCGGFIFGVRINHTMSDAVGMAQFLKTIGEMGRGALAPTTPPCWKREFFCARDPPCVKFPHRDESGGEMTYTAFDDMIEKTFFFGHSQVSALRRLVPHDLRDCSTFDIITVCLRRCRAVAFQFNPKDDVYTIFPVNVRRLNFNPPMPLGYYGNAHTLAIASTTAENLYNKSFGYALESVKKAKANVTEEYIRSLIDLTAIKGFFRFPGMKGGRCFMASDIKPAFGGPIMSHIPGIATFYAPYKNQNGEDGIAIQMYFPPAAMKIFESELHNMLNDKHFMIMYGL